MLYLASILVLLGLGIIASIIGKKMPLLANIDLSKIAAERQAEVKKRIINQKFKRNFFAMANKFGAFLRPVARSLAKFLTFLYNKLVNLKSSYEAEEKIGLDQSRRLEILFAEAEDLIHKGEPTKAESKYIEIIGLDSKNYKAFQSLGDLYSARNSYQEAEETLDHAVKLLEGAIKRGQTGKEMELAKACFSACTVAIALNDNIKALAKIKKALDLEANSPRYLDKACEICLNLKDGFSALEYCRKLEQVNPGNKKLKEFKDKIRELDTNQEIRSSVAESGE